MQIGDKIKIYREKTNISQEKLAELSHISLSAIRKYETNVRTPKDDQIDKLARAMQINPIAFKDMKIKTSGDVIALLYLIGNQVDIEFIGEKDSTGKYIDDSISIKFNDSEISSFLRDWADKQLELDNLEKALDIISDNESKKMMENRIKEFKDEMENSLVLDRLSKEFYMEITYSPTILSPKLPTNLDRLSTYADFLSILNNLARSSNISFECLGVYQKKWKPKAIFTFDATTLDESLLSDSAIDLFSNFIYCFNQFKELGYETDSYAYEQGNIKIYRYIIYDQTLATSLDIINDVINACKSGLLDDLKQKNQFDEEIKKRIEQYQIEIKSIN